MSPIRERLGSSAFTSLPAPVVLCKPHHAAAECIRARRSLPGRISVHTGVLYPVSRIFVPNAVDWAKEYVYRK